MNDDNLIKIKENYETSIKNRIELVNEIEKLDNKLSILTKEIEKNNKIGNKIIENKENNKKLLKKQIKTSINATLISFAVVVLIDLVMPTKLSALPFQLLTVAGINLTANMIPYFFFKKDLKKIKSKYRIPEELEKEYDETLANRIALGSKYKKTRDIEILNEKIYKYTEKKLNHQNDQQEELISTKDIFWKIRYDKPLNETSKHEKIKILNEKLKEYLQDKIIEKYNNAVAKETLEIFNITELLEILTRDIPTEKKKELLTYIIHAMLGLISNVQEYSVIWSEQNNISLIQDPQIKYTQENMVDELITHQNTDYIMLFNKLYDVFISLGITKEKARIKKK